MRSVSDIERLTKNVQTQMFGPNEMKPELETIEKDMTEVINLIKDVDRLIIDRSSVWIDILIALKGGLPRLSPYRSNSQIYSNLEFAMILSQENYRRHELIAIWRKILTTFRKALLQSS